MPLNMSRENQAAWELVIEGYCPEELLEIGRTIVSEAAQLFIDFDVEGDGPAGYGSTRSLGAVTPSGETFYSEIAPYLDTYVEGNHKFCEEHGLERERLSREAPGVLEVVADFGSWIRNEARKEGKQPVGVGLNVGYDQGHVDFIFALAGAQNPLGVSALDLKSFIMSLYPDWDWSKTSKSNIPELLVPKIEFTHNALADSVWQQHVHFMAAAINYIRNVSQ